MEAIMRKIALFAGLLGVIMSASHQTDAMQNLSPKYKLALGLGCFALSAYKPNNEKLSFLLGRAFMGWSHNQNGRITEIGIRANLVPLIAGGLLVKSALAELMHR